MEIVFKSQNDIGDGIGATILGVRHMCSARLHFRNLGILAFI